MIFRSSLVIRQTQDERTQNLRPFVVTPMQSGRPTSWGQPDLVSGGRLFFQVFVPGSGEASIAVTEAGEQLILAGPFVSG